MATLVAASSASTPPSLDALPSSPTPSTSSLFPSPSKTARSHPVSRSSSFSSNTRFARPSTSTSTTPTHSSCSLPSHHKRASLSNSPSPHTFQDALLSPTSTGTGLPSNFSQAELHSILVAAASAQLSHSTTPTSTPPPSPPSMRSLSHSQATARSNNAMGPSKSGRASRPTSALYQANTGETLIDDMSDSDTVGPSSLSAAIARGAGTSSAGLNATQTQDKENLHSSYTSGVKTPSRSPSNSSLLHQPFKHQPGSTTTPLSACPASSPSSSYPPKYTLNRSSVSHTQSSSARSSRAGSIVGESTSPASASGHLSPSLPQHSVDKPVACDGNGSDDSDSVGPAKVQRKERTFSASHKSRRMSSTNGTSSNNASITPTKSPNARTAPLASTSPRQDGLHSKERRSRRGSASSARDRSRQGSSGSISTTPRSTRAGSGSFGNALDLLPSSHAQSSSLSNRSDTTLHAATFSFSPPGLSTKEMEEDDEVDEVASASNRSGPSLASGGFSPSVSERASRVGITIIKIKDFAFPVDDPRYIGEAAPPTPTDIPDQEAESLYGSWISPNSLNGQSANGPINRQCDPSPALSIISSSSSSSLSSGFTPPPFGSFGYGHHYHYAGSGNARFDANSATNAERDAQGQLRLPTGGSWSTWDHTNLDGTSGNDGSNAGTPTSNTSSGNNNTIGRMWTFSNDNSNGIVPSTILDSALSIEDFDDEFDEDEDDDFEVRSYTHDPARDRDIDENHNNTQEEGNGEMTAEEKANEESFANLPAGTGIYKVQYDFASEAPGEMEVKEGDHVRVWQQLCDGWVLGAKVIRKDSNQNDRIEYKEPCSGLVPQCYLLFSHTVTLAQGNEDSTEGEDRTICYTTQNLSGKD